MGVFLAAHAHRLAGIGVVEPRLLGHSAAAFDDSHLARNLVIERLFEEAEGVEVLHLGLDAEFLRSLETNGHVRVAAEMAFLHVAGGDAGELKHLFDRRQIGIGFIGSAHIGLADDLDEGVPERLRST